MGGPALPHQSPTVLPRPSRTGIVFRVPEPELVIFDCDGVLVDTERMDGTGIC